MKLKRLFLILMILIWAIVVYALSNEEGEASSGLSRRIVSIFVKEERIVDIVEPYARKVAHFSEYFVGGVLFLLLFRTYNLNDIPTIVYTSIMGTWYALTDEWHQKMIIARKASLFDVFIDFLGCITGACIMLLIIKIIEHIKMKKKEKNYERFKRRIRPGT